MKYKYFNEGAFSYVIKMVSDNRLDQAIVEFEKYLQKYPKDYCAYSYYADSLIKLGRFDEAEVLLSLIPVDSRIPELSKENVILMKLKLFSSRGQYEDCLEIIRENFEMFDRRGWAITESLIFFKKQLGLLLADDYKGFSYKVNLITDYSEEAAIECIRTTHCPSESCPPRCFYDDFPVEDVYHRLRDLLPLENRIYSSIIENIYIFKYENCGKVDNKVVNYIKVVTFQNSNDIITMYPYENRERIDCMDLTPVIEDEIPKEKKLSQIDKFNQRYSKFS